ncbi:MAG: helix-turn-helix transcriptional regulator [Pseudomonadota bacterium]
MTPGKDYKAARASPVNGIDRVVGETIRILRKECRMTQADLGESIGVSPGQLQKYEAGVNRVGATQLWRLSIALDVPVGEFFRGLYEVDEGDMGSADSGLHTELEVVRRQYSRIVDPTLRKSIRDILERMAANDDGND